MTYYRSKSTNKIASPLAFSPFIFIANGNDTASNNCNHLGSFCCRCFRRHDMMTTELATTAIIRDLCAATVSNEVTIMRTELDRTAITWDLFVAVISNDMTTATTEPSITAITCNLCTAAISNNMTMATTKPVTTAIAWDLLHCHCVPRRNNDNNRASDS